MGIFHLSSFHLFISITRVAIGTFKPVIFMGHFRRNYHGAALQKRIEILGQVFFVLKRIEVASREAGSEIGKKNGRQLWGNLVPFMGPIGKTDYKDYRKDGLTPEELDRCWHAKAELLTQGMIESIQPVVNA